MVNVLYIGQNPELETGGWQLIVTLTQAFPCPDDRAAEPQDGDNTKIPLPSMISK